ncbi:MBOAT family protein [Histomonas meleagridis]|uniref:MBOAT family protein n=1 Tax=Histomonas meleagridis TaxID=135588 RepID=UPI00355ABA71|nr:MBOAT family protein [Histomonas meleagridis]KAH0803950.1 MBOAT family protein [Histomonas meleagridis]
MEKEAKKSLFAWFIDVYEFIGPVFWLCTITMSLMPLYRWVLPKIKSRYFHSIFHIITGLFLTRILYKNDFIIPILITFITYFIIDKNPYIVSLIAMGINTAVNLYQKLKANESWDFEVTAITMILFNRIVFTTFNLSDGRKIKEGKPVKREFSKRLALDKKPSLLDWFAYCITPMGGNSGPCFEFKIFEYILTIGDHPQISADSKSRKYANKRFLSSIFWSVFNILFMNKVQISFYSQPWFVRQNVFIRFLLSIVCTIGQFCRYYPAWHPVESSIYETGVCETPLVEDFYDCSNMGLVQLLTTPSVGAWLQVWNHTSHIFFKRYLFYQLKDNGFSYSFSHHSVFVVSALWHGFDPVYLMLLPELVASSVADQMLQKYYPRSSRSKLGNLLYHFWKVISMTNATSTFWYRTFDSFFFVRRSCGYIGTILTFGVFIGVNIYAKIIGSKKKDKKEPTPEKNLKKE